MMIYILSSLHLCWINQGKLKTNKKFDLFLFLVVSEIVVSTICYILMILSSFPLLGSSLMGDLHIVGEFFN